MASQVLVVSLFILSQIKKTKTKRTSKRHRGTCTLTGRHCCLWYHIESSDLAVDPSARGPVVPRTMDSLKSDLESFQRDGSNIKRAKFYNNVIREPYFPISLEKAS